MTCEAYFLMEKCSIYILEDFFFKYFLTICSKLTLNEMISLRACSIVSYIPILHRCALLSVINCQCDKVFIQDRKSCVRDVIMTLLPISSRHARHSTSSRHAATRRSCILSSALTAYCTQYTRHSLTHSLTHC